MVIRTYTWICSAFGAPSFTERSVPFRHIYISDQPGQDCTGGGATAESVSHVAATCRPERSRRGSPHGGTAGNNAGDGEARLSRGVRTRGRFSPAGGPALAGVDRHPAVHMNVGSQLCRVPGVQGGMDRRAISCGGWPAGRGRSLARLDPAVMAAVCVQVFVCVQARAGRRCSST